MHIGWVSAVLFLLGYFPYQGFSLECYVCNSDNDPRCGDPFGNYTIGKLNCSLKIPPEHLKGEERESRICRKIVQKIYGKTRVVRSCGYITDENRDDKMCVKRSGTHDVQLIYCSCTTDLCNGVQSTHSAVWLAPLATVTLAVAARL